ncbi:YecR family lipoprotein [Salmonella enterica]
MNKIVIAALGVLLTGCTFTKEAKVSEVDPVSGIVRLSFDQQMMQTARYDQYTAQGTANRQCQQMGYANAVPFGQPVETCSLISGSACMNTKMTIQYQCRGIAINPAATSW